MKKKKKKFFYFFKLLAFDLKSCGKGVVGQNPHRTLTTKYTFIRYVPLRWGTPSRAYKAPCDPLLRRAIKLM